MTRQGSDFFPACGDPMSTTDLAEAVLDLGALAMQFASIKRTACYHPDQVTRESDSDHTVMLAWIAPALADRFYSALDVGLVAQFAVLHDMAEVYAGDTNTLRITGPQRVEKEARETAAVGRITCEFGFRLPWVARTLRAYELQHAPEARFVRLVDKFMPKIVHLLDRCTGLLEEGMDVAELTETFEQQRLNVSGYAGNWVEVMDLRQNLVQRTLTALGEALADEAQAVADAALVSELGDALTGDPEAAA